MITFRWKAKGWKRNGRKRRVSTKRGLWRNLGVYKLPGSKNANKWKNREKQRQILKQQEQTCSFWLPTGAGSTGNNGKEGLEKRRWRRTWPTWGLQRKKTLSGGINGTRRCGKEFAIKHTLLICWQPVPTRCQVKAGVGDSLRSACRTGWCHAGDFDFIAGKGRLMSRSIINCLFIPPIQRNDRRKTAVTWHFMQSKYHQTSSSWEEKLNISMYLLFLG